MLYFEGWGGKLLLGRLSEVISIQILVLSPGGSGEVAVHVVATRGTPN